MNSIRINQIKLGGLIFLLAACEGGKSANTFGSDISESAQQVGDVSASVDEMGGSGGSVATFPSKDLFYKRSGLQSEGSLQASLLKLISPLQMAYAAACRDSNTFSSCSSNQITRTFGACSIGSAIFEGTVDLTWQGDGATNCHMTAVDDSISREPNYTVTGLRGSVLSVVATGVEGQKLQWESGSGAERVFSFSNDGIRRTFTKPNSEVLFDFQSETTQPITVSGSGRSSRVLNGGELKVTNLLSGTECDLVPQNVTWNPSCNCPVSGNWEGSCSDGKNYSIELTGCGTANLNYGEDAQSLTFDRCYSLE